MNKRQRKKQNQRPVTLCQVPEGVYAEDLLFKPITYDSGSKTEYDFESCMIPFRIQGDKLFLIHTMDCCDISIYLTCMTLNKGRLSGYHDMSDAMKECLKIQEETGIEYYYGKLNSVYNRYMYALGILLDKKIIDKKKAMELIQDVDFDKKRFEKGICAVNTKLSNDRTTRRKMTSAGNAILEFMGLLTGEEDKEE